MKTTLDTIENLLALLTGDKLEGNKNARCQWEIDFVRFLLGFTTQKEEAEFNRMTLDHERLCESPGSVTQNIGKGLTRLLRHTTSKFKDEMNQRGAVPMHLLFDQLRSQQNPLQQHATGRVFAAMLCGNDKQRFFVDIKLSNSWNPARDDFSWMVFIGCHQGHSSGVIAPEAINHRLSPVECFAHGWIFHITDRRFQESIETHGLKRTGRDALHFVYENDASLGYIAKGAGTKAPRKYNSTIYVVLNIQRMLEHGYDLFLTGNGVVLVYDDVPRDYFQIIFTFPHLNINVFNPTTGHSLPREVRHGNWRPKVDPLHQYMKYLSSDEISKYFDNGIFNPDMIPKNIVPKRRSTAWEFMSQEPPASYLKCIKALFEGTSSSSTSVEVFDVDAEFSTLNNLETQSVKIISENPWHLYQAGVLTLRGLEGQKITNEFKEPVVVIREFWKMSTTQQKTLREEGITRHDWERCPLAGHSVFFMTRAWELGRLTACVKQYIDDADKVEYQRALEGSKEVGWLRDTPAPCEPQDESSEGLERFVIEKEEYLKDEGEVRMFQLFSEGIEDLYNGMIEKFVPDTPALWEEFAMRLPSGDYYLVDPYPSEEVPTVPTSENICLDIHNNVKFSPKLCLWAIQKKLEATGERFAKGQFAEFCLQELKEYIDSRSHLDDSLYRHLLIDIQSRTFQDSNYVNTIGSKVVIKPVGEMMELSVKKNKILQGTMVFHQPEKATSSQVTSGDLPTGEIPEVMDAVSTEHLPTGEISVKEAQEEDVEMEAVKEEEKIPQDDPMQEEEEVQEQGPVEVEEEADYSEGESITQEEMDRANAVVNSSLIDAFAREEHDDAPVEERPRMASKAQAKFLDAMLGEDRATVDAMLRREREILEDIHRGNITLDQVIARTGAARVPGHLPPGEIPEAQADEEMKKEEPEESEKEEEVKTYQVELEARKTMDIFSQPSSAEFLKLLAPETEPSTEERQARMEDMFVSRRSTYRRPFQNKIQEKLDDSLEKEPRTRIYVPKPQPRGEDRGEGTQESALDGLATLDKYYKSKYFGFYGKGFRETHNKALNFEQYRKEPTVHPCAKFDFDEKKFIEKYCDLFCSTPTPDDYFYQKAIIYSCEDHRLKVADDDKMIERSKKANEDFVKKKKKTLEEQVRTAGKDDMSYDNMITDITELFLSGEAFARNVQSVGSSSKSLTVLSWN